MNEVPVAGIDVSKGKSDICVLAPDNSILFRAKILHELDDMTRLVKRLSDVETEYGARPVLVMEATGHYHRVLQNFLRDAGFEVLVINPIQSGGLKNINIRKTKNDRIDAHRIAMLYRLKTIKPTNTPTEILTDLRMLCRQHFDLVNDSVAYKNRLRAMLDQCFPAYDRVFSDIDGLASLSVLTHFPTPEILIAATDSEIENSIYIAVKRSQTFYNKKVSLLRKTAQNALPLCSNTASSGILIRNLVSILKNFADAIRETNLQIRRLIRSDEDVQRNIDLLTSIPGIADYSAAVILSEIGDFSSFQKPKQLVAFFGLDPSERQSGTFKGTKNKISKRGSRYLRGILNMCAHVSIHPGCNGRYANPVLAAYFEKKCASKPYKSALCAVMHKLVNIVFAVLRDQKPFELRLPEEHCEIMRQRSAFNKKIA